MSMLHEITGQVPRYKDRMRKGRGEGSGKGKTAGRGTKGSGQRGGKPGWVRGHEGGQTRLYRRLPTRGFSNDNFETNWYIVNVEDLNRFDNGATVDADALINARLVPDKKRSVKILGNGAVTKKLTVLAGWYSKSAHEKINGAGGAAQNLKGEAFAFPKPTPRFAKQIKKGGAKKAGEAAPAEGAAPAAAEGGEKVAEKPAEKPEA
jgi:large subunit ribosomal protein L15